MSIIKERIKFNNVDVNLKIDLGVRNRFSGYQQEIDELTEETKEELINPVIDYEVERYPHEPNRTNTVYFYFSNAAGTSHANTFTNAGFTSTEIEDFDDVVLNSFFIMDFFDTYDHFTQRKLFTTYNTLILDSETSGGDPIPKYKLSNTVINQFFYQYVPKWFLDSQTETTIPVYIKFSFYSAKSGRVSLFYNNAEAVSSPERMYFKGFLYTHDRDWNFDEGVNNAYELPPNNTYATKVNDAVETFENLQQNAPEGAFNPEDGTYEGFSARSRARGSATRTTGSSGGRTVGDRDLGTSVPRDGETDTEDTDDDPIIDRPTRPDRDAER